MEFLALFWMGCHWTKIKRPLGERDGFLMSFESVLAPSICIGLTWVPAFGARVDPTGPDWVFRGAACHLLRPSPGHDLAKLRADLKHRGSRERPIRPGLQLSQMESH